MEESLPHKMLQKLLDLLKLESFRPHQEIDADICGELPDLPETDAERSTGVPLLSAAESTDGLKHGKFFLQ